MSRLVKNLTNVKTNRSQMLWLAGTTATATATTYILSWYRLMTLACLARMAICPRLVAQLKLIGHKMTDRNYEILTFIVPIHATEVMLSLKITENKAYLM